MKRRRIAWLLLAVLLLALIGCGAKERQRDALYGTWTLKSSRLFPDWEQQIRDGTFRRTYTFDGMGSGVRVTEKDGKTTETPFTYELKEQGTTVMYVYLNGDTHALQVPYSIAGNTMTMQIRLQPRDEWLACEKEY